MSLRRKILIAVGIALVVAILIPVIHHYQLRAATEAYIAHLKAHGEPMELAQVLPPTVLPDQNSADTFRKAVALLDADQGFLGTNYGVDCMRMVALGKAMLCSQQPEVQSYDGSYSWDVATTAVIQNKDSFALLQQIIAKPNFDFKIIYNQGVADLNFTNLYLAESKRAAQRLETVVLYNLHRGDTPSAVTNLQTMLVIVKAMQNERLLISELVGIAIANIALAANWEVLQSTNLTDEQLAKLQKDWESLDFIRGGENALAMERMIGGITLAKWRNSPSKLLHYLEAPYEFGLSDFNESAYDKLKIRIKALLWRYWWSYPDELQLMRGYQISLETIRSAETNYSLLSLLREQENKLNQIGIHTNSSDSLFFPDVKRVDLHYFISGTVFSWTPLFDRVMRAESTKQMAIAAIALKRYQLKNGKYPTDLRSLVPEFVPKVPLDPVDGQPLRYRLNADGTFLLYSVGENGKDDGGNPALEKGSESSYPDWQNRRALDWVWPQPATAAEIQNYYAHPPK